MKQITYYISLIAVVFSLIGCANSTGKKIPDGNWIDVTNSQQGDKDVQKE